MHPVFGASAPWRAATGNFPQADPPLRDPPRPPSSRGFDARRRFPQDPPEKMPGEGPLSGNTGPMAGTPGGTRRRAVPGRRPHHRRAGRAVRRRPLHNLPSAPTQTTRRTDGVGKRTRCDVTHLVYALQRLITSPGTRTRHLRHVQMLSHERSYVGHQTGCLLPRRARRPGGLVDPDAPSTTRCLRLPDLPLDLVSSGGCIVERLP